MEAFTQIYDRLTVLRGMQEEIKKNLTSVRNRICGEPLETATDNFPPPPVNCQLDEIRNSMDELFHHQVVNGAPTSAKSR